MRLTDPLQKYAGSVMVPSFASAPPITLLELATHTAGLPHEMGYAPDKPPFTWPTRADRWAWLAKEKLGWAPGSIAAYPNAGFDFLADALATAAVSGASQSRCDRAARDEGNGIQSDEGGVCAADNRERPRRGRAVPGYGRDRRQRRALQHRGGTWGFLVVNRADFGMFEVLTRGVDGIIANLVTR